MTAPPIPIPAFPAPWSATVRSKSKTSVLLDIRRSDLDVAVVELERCAAGRLRHAYPVNAHDIEARVGDATPRRLLPDLLAALTSAVEAAEPRCRRIIFAAATGDSDTLAAAESAGFRFVVEVGIPDAELSLMVAEPDWVTTVDMDLDQVPGT
ncbi:hypothetical protein [Nocardia fluminea]|uniref:hypothetical protein n=1 Tax=Nocardia fluminea TaxID=134984 RepID=UPI0033ED5A51